MQEIWQSLSYQNTQTTCCGLPASYICRDEAWSWINAGNDAKQSAGVNKVEAKANI